MESIESLFEACPNSLLVRPGRKNQQEWLFVVQVIAPREACEKVRDWLEEQSVELRDDRASLMELLSDYVQLR